MDKHVATSRADVGNPKLAFAGPPKDGEEPRAVGMRRTS